MPRDIALRIVVDNAEANTKLAATDKAIDGLGTSATTATKAVGTSSGTGLVGSLGLMALSLTGLGIGAAVKNVVEFGSKLSDLSAKTGLSYKELQILGIAGDQVGVSMETTARGVNRLQKELVEGTNKGAVGAIKTLGLEMDTLLQMSPGQMFHTLSEAIAKVPEPAERTALAMALLGRSGADMLPLMIEDIDKLASGVTIMSDNAVRGLDWIDDAWSRLKNGTKAQVGEIIYHVTSLRGALDGLTSGFSEGFYQVANVTKDTLEPLAASVKHVSNTAALLPPALRDARDVMAEFDRENKESEDAIKKNNLAIEAHRKAINSLADAYTGRALAKQVADVTEAYDLSRKQGGLLASQVVELSKDLDKLRERGAVLRPDLGRLADAFSRNAQVLQRDLRPVVVDYVSDVDAMNIAHYEAQQQFDALLVKGKDLAGFFQNALGPIIRDLPAAPVDKWQMWREGAAAEVDRFVRYVQSGDALGGLVQYASDFARDFAAGFADVFLPGMGQIIAAAWPIIQQGLVALGRLIGNFFSWVWKGLKGLFGGGIGTVPDPQTTPEFQYDPNTGGNPGNGDPNDPNGNQTQFATGGFVPASPGGRPFRLGDGGEGEWVVPQSKLANFVGGFVGGGASIDYERLGAAVARALSQSPINLDGRRVAEGLVPHMGYARQRWGLA